MKSYEEFSPEAKQAIEQFRKFTSGLNPDQVESYDSGRPYWFIENLHFNNHKSFEKIMYYGCHMFSVSYDEAKDLVIQILKDIKFKKIIITTPDSRFNSNYFMSEKFRHHDHKFEFDRNQFIEFMTKCIAESGLIKECSYVFEDLGDVVDGVSTSQACIVSSLS